MSASIFSRSFDGSGEILLPRRNVREVSPLSRESPKPEPQEVTKRKLSSGIRASSLECTTKGGLLSPPTNKRGCCHDSTRATHSLEQLHTSDIRLEVPRMPSRSASRLSNPTSPTSSEPTLPVEDVPRVNFSKNTKPIDCDSDKEEDDCPVSNPEEIQPMLPETMDVIEVINVESDSLNKRQAKCVRSWLTGFMKPKPSNKIPMNGLHRDSLV